MKVKEALQKNVVFIVFAFVISVLLILDTAGYSIKITYGDMPRNSQNVPKVKGTMVTYKNERGLSTEYLVNDKYNYGKSNLHSGRGLKMR